MATKNNLVIDQGASFTSSITLLEANGDPQDLTTSTGEAQLRRHYTSTNAVSFEVTLGGNTGVIELSLTAAQTAALGDGRYVYDVLITESTANTVTRVREGIVTVTPTVTR